MNNENFPHVPSETFRTRNCDVNSHGQKEDLLADWKSHENSSIKKRGRSEEFADINNAVWRWFCMAREALIPVSGPMIQEEAMQIA